MKTFQQFMIEAEAYDADLMRSATVRRVKDPSERRKTTPELRRRSQKKDPKTGERAPSQYKPRTKPTERSSSTQAPTQERGSAREAQLAAAKAERRRAAQARAAAKKSGASVTPTEKPKASELSAQAKKLTAKKAQQVDKRPADQPKRPAVGMSRAERSRITKKGERRLRDLVLQSTGKKKESELKHKYVTW